MEPFEVPEGKIFDLETAIKMHLDGQRKGISPLRNAAINHSVELHIKTIESAPRNSVLLLKRIAEKKKQKEKVFEVSAMQDLVTQIDALEWLLSLFRQHEEGRALDTLAW